MAKKKNKSSRIGDTAASKAAKLEELLFGKPSDGLFGGNVEEEVEEAEVAAAAENQQHDGPAYFMDTVGRDDKVLAILSDDDDDDDEEEEEEGNEEEVDKEDEEEEVPQGRGAEKGAQGKEKGEPKQKASSSRGKGAVWNDPDVDKIKVDVAGGHSRSRKLREKESQRMLTGLQYEEALRKQHAAMNSRTSWAATSSSKAKRARPQKGYGAESEEEEEEEEENKDLQLQAGGLLASTGRGRLMPGEIEVTRMKDANQHEPNSAVVQSLQFHTGGHPLLMTAGLDKKIRLFQVDGKRNPKVQSIHLDDCPVQQAAFANGGKQIVAAGRRSFFYIYDLAASKIERVHGPSGCPPQKSLETFAVGGGGASCSDPVLAFAGDQGYIPLVSLKSRQWVGHLKMNGSVRAMAFAPSGQELLTTGSDGMVYTWDMRMRRCVGKMVDYGGNMNAAALAISPNDKYFATGSSSGVVNLYSKDAAANAGPATGAKRIAAAPAAPKPLKEIMNLTTTTDTLVFSPDSQILAVASRLKKDSMRLVHVPSLTVFSNWPTTRTPLHYVHSVAFSPNGGFLAVGNAKGRALLYRLHHYPEI